MTPGTGDATRRLLAEWDERVATAAAVLRELDDGPWWEGAGPVPCPGNEAAPVRTGILIGGRNVDPTGLLQPSSDGKGHSWSA